MCSNYLYISVFTVCVFTQTARIFNVKTKTSSEVLHCKLNFSVIFSLFYFLVQFIWNVFIELLVILFFLELKVDYVCFSVHFIAVLNA